MLFFIPTHCLAALISPSLPRAFYLSFPTYTLTHSQPFTPSAPSSSSSSPGSTSSRTPTSSVSRTAQNSSFPPSRPASASSPAPSAGPVSSNNRSFLTTYNLFTWITFAFLVVPRYTTYRRRGLNLEGQINASERLLIRDELKCWSYFSPFVEATISQTCYARSILPGCKLPYLRFQRVVLQRWYTGVFALVPTQLALMIAGLLCSDHTTYRFGKGMMPEAYRLNMGAMAVIMENDVNQLAEQYGSEVAADILKRLQLNLNFASPGRNSYGNSG